MSHDDWQSFTLALPPVMTQAPMKKKFQGPVQIALWHAGPGGKPVSLEFDSPVGAHQQQ
jgi:hypothetical protein